MAKKRTLKKYAPLLVTEWSERNGELTPVDVTIGSHKKVWWKGSCGHEWEAIVKNRVNGSGCPYCSGNKVLAGFNDLASKAPMIAKEWSNKNGTLKPVDVTAYSNKEVWWNGSCGHEWRSRIADRVQKGCGCPYCTSEKVEVVINDVFTQAPELKAEWSEKNFRAISPVVLTGKSTRNVWWKCSKCGFEWKAQIRSRVAGRHPCPRCRKRERDRILQEKYDDLHMRTRFVSRLPHEAVRYYLGRVGIETVFDDDSVIGLPFDIYSPDKRIAIMIAQSLLGKSRQKAMVGLCNRAGIRLLYIIPNGDMIYNNCHCIVLTGDTPEIWSETIQATMDILGIKADVDIRRDREEIFENFKAYIFINKRH